MRTRSRRPTGRVTRSNVGATTLTSARSLFALAGSTTDRHTGRSWRPPSKRPSRVVLASIIVNAIDPALDIVLAHAAVLVTAHPDAHAGFDHQVPARVDLCRPARVCEHRPQSELDASARLRCCARRARAISATRSSTSTRASRCRITIRHHSWPVFWPATPTARHPYAKESHGAREPENEKRDAEVREGRQPGFGVDSPKHNDAASQHDGQRDRKRNRPRPLPSQSGPPFSHQ